MRSVIVGVLAGAVALVASLSGVASATGPWPVQVNTTASTWSGANVVLSVLTASGARAGTCRSVVYRVSIASDGTVSVPAGGATYSTCTVSGVTVTMTQVGAWAGAIRHLDNVAGQVSSFTTTLNIAKRVSGAGCTFTMAGVLLGEWAQAPLPVAHNVLVNIPGFVFPAALAPALSLTISNVSGTCALLGIANGNAAAIAGTFNAAPAINLAGIF